jgi:hypothetical protein
MDGVFLVASTVGAIAMFHKRKTDDSRSRKSVLPDLQSKLGRQGREEREGRLGGRFLVE